MCSTNDVPNLEEPRYDQESFWGRAKNNFWLRNPMNLFVSSSRLEEAKCLFCKYRCGEPLPEDITDDELWRSKSLFDSAYNNETGEKIHCLAKPSAQIPMHALFGGGTMAFNHNPLGVILWQWLNQTYNSFVGYATRVDEDSVTNQQLGTSYGLATGTAIGTALALNHLVKCCPPLCAKFVPFAAVAAAHCVSVPLIKAQTLKNGAPIYDDSNARLAHSKIAAQAGISGEIMNRIMFAAPPMLLTPFVMDMLERRGTLCRYPWINLPANVGIAALCLLFISPLTCAFLNNQGAVPYKHLEPEIKEYLCRKFSSRPPKYVYYDRNM